MLFRKTYNQVSFLHWYHHASVFMMWWFNVRYYPGGEGTKSISFRIKRNHLAYPSAWLNSFVHVWMYSYYLFSTLGFRAWWKKYLTQLQISQLTMFVVQVCLKKNVIDFQKGISLMFTGAQEFRFIGIINGLYALTILVLFIKFYLESYSKPREEGKSSSEAVSPKKSRKTRKDD